MPSEGGKITFYVADYVIFAATLSVSTAIGIYFACSGGRQRTPAEYLLGNRRLHVIPVTLSFVASLKSAITVLGVPAEIYFYGIQYIGYAVGVIPACVFLAFVFVPMMYPLKLTSIFEYLQLRFQSHAVKVVGSLTNIICEVLYAGLAVFAPSIAMEAVTGIPMWASMVFLVGLCTFYTALGGIMAVVWADAFQIVVMIGAWIAIIIMGTMKVGGVSEIFTRLTEGGRMDVSFAADPTRRDTVWNFFIGFSIQFIFLASGQTAGQRISSLPTLKQAKLLYLLAIPGFQLTMVLSAIVGGIIFAYYDKTGCDPKAAGYITNSNQILPYFLADVFGYPGVSGVFIACIFCAVVSTVSSIQNGLSAIIWEDYLKTKLKAMSEWRKTILIKIIVVFVGVLTLAVGFMASQFSGTLLQIYAVTGSFMGARFGLFLLGGTTSFVGATACLLGAASGVLVSITFIVLHLLNPPDWPKLPTRVDGCVAYNNVSSNATAYESVSYNPPYHTTEYTPANSSAGLADRSPHRFVSNYYFGLIGCSVTVIVALLLSLIPALRNKNHVEPKYMFPFFRKSVAVSSQPQELESMKLQQNADEVHEVHEATTTSA